jgi:outer membrane protein OmpA-like peptidoglycan-associated protein
VQPTEAALSEVDRLAHLLEQYPDMKIELHGPKDDTKAKEQAIKVSDMLKKSGVKSDRLLITQMNAVSAFSFTITADKPQIIADKIVSKDFNKTIDVNKISNGERFRINELFFMSDSTSFTPNSIRALDELADFLRKNSNTQVEIGGHTSGLPAHVYCDKLSLERAENVVKYLISRGVNANQLSAKGYGKRAPVSDNATEYGRRMNQRVEVKILKANGLKLGRKKVTKDGSRNKVKINPKNGKNVGIKKWMMMKKWKNQIVKNGVKIRKKSGMRDGVKYIRMDRNKSGLINGLLRME